ncbi:MAG: hypothetical protein Q7R91_02990 [bacterium]|nr:hypothetical protein [bacterium]
MQEQFRKSKILYTGEAVNTKAKKRFSLKLFFIIFAVILSVSVVAGVFYALRLPRLRIQEISIVGAKSILEDDISSLALSDISGSSFYLIPKDSYFFVRLSRIENLIKNKFLRIVEVRAQKTFKSALNIVVTERDIWGMGCIKTEIKEVAGIASKQESIKKTGPCFYIDKTGFAFEDVSSFEGGLLPVVYTDGEGTLGSSIIQSSNVAFFEEAAKTLESSLQLPLLSVEISSKNSDDVRLNLKEGWSLIVLRNKPSSNWISFLKTLLDGEIKDKRAGLDYVDLRFGNKVFYKYR